MPGDKQVTLPSEEATLGVTDQHRAGGHLPWLSQIGCRRGGNRAIPFAAH